MHRRLSAILTVALLAMSAYAEEPPLAPDVRAIPGESPTPWLRYQNAAVTNVIVAGSWDDWAGRYPLQVMDGLWTIDTRTLKGSFGQHEYKFLPNGEWEKGENRMLYLNPEGLLERPSEAVFNAEIDARDEIVVHFRRGIPPSAQFDVALVPEVAIADAHVASGREAASLQGYFIAGGLITFLLEEQVYGLKLPPAERVTVAGNFNGWDSSGGGGRWQLRDENDDGIWELTAQLPGLRAPAGEKDLIFKFVIGGSRWLVPPPGSLNALSDGKGNTNLRIDPQSAGGTSLKIKTQQPMDLSRNYMVVIKGLDARPVWYPVTPGRVMDTFVSDKPLGAILDRANGCTTYRIFAPRARGVSLAIYKGPEYEVHKPSYKRIEPVERYPLWKDPVDGVWEISLLGLDIGKYYSFNIDGPSGNGEAFNALASVGDPYGRAAAHAHNNTIVMDPEETNEWWSGWTDGDYKTPPLQDVVIYEMHVRDMTMHPSSGVQPPLAGKYEGLLATDGLGTGLDHLRDLGVNFIEFLPTAEFPNGEDEFNWGYAPVFYFAPEASYARAPLKGSQYFEFKRLVNELHKRGIGVILDVVFNHVGSPNIFNLMDKKYFFRLNPDFTYSNYSGCGNDLKTESLMMRRLIVDNIIYWMTEFHVDGFRFDLAELVDLETLMQVRDAARAINTNVVLISEPWSFRGENKHQLTGTGWSAWNNDFRYAAKDFVMGRRNRDWLQRNIFGSVDTWAANPLQPVNYVESHDDMALADELCTRPDRDGRNLQEMDVAVNRLAATVLFTSLGIPMISEGQEFLRSKWGIHNTYNRGDEVNAIRWTDRDRPLAAQALAYYRGLIRLRQSPQGAAFRVAARPPASYYQWVMPPDEQALGYIVNAPRIHEGNGFIVLLNSNGATTPFSFNLPPGRWRLIGDGVNLDPAGLPDTPVVEGGQPFNVQVPGLRSYIFMDGF